LTVAAKITPLGPVAVDGVITIRVLDTLDILASAAELIANLAHTARITGVSTVRDGITVFRAIAVDAVVRAVGIVGRVRARIRALITRIVGACHTIVTRSTGMAAVRNGITVLRAVAIQPIVGAISVDRYVIAQVQILVTDIVSAAHAIITGWSAGLAHMGHTGLRTVAVQVVITVGIVVAVCTENGDFVERDLSVRVMARPRVCRGRERDCLHPSDHPNVEDPYLSPVFTWIRIPTRIVRIHEDNKCCNTALYLEIEAVVG
jgi:hypothetical protein